MKKYDIFISYSRKDKVFVFDFFNKLYSLGFNVWIDRNGIGSGDDYEDVIIDAIDDSDVVLFMVSESSLASDNVKKEIKYAHRENKRVIPFLIDGTPLVKWAKFTLGGVDNIDSRKEEQVNKLIDDLRSWCEVSDVESIEQSTVEDPKEDDSTEMPIIEEPIDNKENKSGDTKTIEDFQNDPMCIVAKKYENGVGVPQNYQIAYEQYVLAANSGNPYAICKQADFLYDGLGVDIDFTKAYKLYKKAYELGYVDASYNIAIMLNVGEGVSRNLKKSFDFFVIAAENGNASAMTELALIYDDGTNFIQQDKEKAIELYNKAIELGEPLAHMFMGFKYYLGEGVNPNVRTAAKYFRIAANHGLSPAQLCLGDFYAKGISVKQDASKAFEWYKKAADNEEVKAYIKVGDSYSDGIGVEKNEKEAFDWYSKAAEAEDEEALFMLGIYYCQGLVVEKNIVLARQYFTQSSASGYTPAFRELLKMDDYELVIENIESITSTSKGQLLTGTIICEHVSVGDTVRVLCSDGYSEAQISNIRILKNKLDHAYNGNNVGLLLNGLKVKEVKGAIELYRKKRDDDDTLTVVDNPQVEVKQPSRKGSSLLSVEFPDGTVICEKKSKDTFIKALQKIGLGKICSSDHGITHSDFPLVGTEVRITDDGYDRQTLVDGYYIYTNISNRDKVKDLENLNQYFDLGLVIRNE